MSPIPKPSTWPPHPCVVATGCEMPCFHPVDAYLKDNGQVSLVERGSIKTSMQLPCGRCQGCRLEKSRQWAIRCMHEASMHKHNCFITLTYNEDHHVASLEYTDFQLFMRYLRRYVKEHTGAKIRFYMAGEYGDQNGRPHFHACIFGFDFPDRKLFRKLPSGSLIYTSEALQKLWRFGYSSVGDVTIESAAYVARYIFKKQFGKNQADHYQACDSRTGELVSISPEFNRMSLKPGIGMEWLAKFHPDIYPKGELIHNGMKMKPPKAYDKYLKKIKPLEYEQLQFQRVNNFNYEDNTYERLAVKEHITKSKLQLKKRGFLE